MHYHNNQLRSHLYCGFINDFWIDQTEGASMSLLNNFNHQNIPSDLPVHTFYCKILYKSLIFYSEIDGTLAARITVWFLINVWVGYFVHLFIGENACLWKFFKSY